MSRHESPIDERDLRDLAALADGSLRGRRREAVERRVQSHPELAALFAEQESAVRAVGAIDVGAPASLRASLARASAQPGRRRLRTPVIGLGLAGAAAAVAAVVVLALPAGTPGAPSVVQAASLGVRPATQAAPVPDNFQRGLLNRSFGGVAYPDWGPGYGWHATGARVDHVRGRQVVTVFYANSRGRRIAYSIVGGGRLAVPSRVSTTYRSHVPYRSLAAASRTVVTWERGGHTCVLSGVDTPASELVKLASFEHRPSGTDY